MCREAVGVGAPRGKAEAAQVQAREVGVGRGVGPERGLHPWSSGAGLLEQQSGVQGGE